MKKYACLAIAALSLISAVSFGNNNGKTPSSYWCYVPQTGQTVRGNEFFSLVHNVSQRSENRGVCVVGKIAFEASSSRIYLNGYKLDKYEGSSSNSEIKAIERAEGCTSITYSCEQSN